MSAHIIRFPTERMQHHPAIERLTDTFIEIWRDLGRPHDRDAMRKLALDFEAKLRKIGVRLR